MKMKIFGNIIRAARGARNWFGGGVAKALVTTAVVLFACTAWAKTYTQSALTNGRKWWYYLDSSGNAVIEHENSSSTYTAAISITATGDLNIPSSLDGHPVVGIGSRAFYACNKITSVTIPEGVTYVDFAAFYNCTSLEEVNLPSSLNEIGMYAFGYCIKLEDINFTVPGNIEKIYAYAFTHCSALESVTIPQTVTLIAANAFESCTSLEEVAIPAAVTFLGNNAFKDCESLDEVTLPASLVAADVKDRCFSGCSEDLEISSTAVSGGLTWHFKVVGGGAELCYNGEDDEATIPDTTSGAIAIPDTLGGFPVTSIGEGAFSKCDKLTSVTIPATVTSIGDWAFEDCSSMVLTVPDTVTSIDDTAFQGCDAMADANGFVIVRGVLHHYADKDDEVTIPDGVTRIGAYAFYECDVERVVIPASVTSIGSSAFVRCEDLEDIMIPATVTSIGERAFYGCESLADKDGFVIVRDVLYYYAGDADTVTIPGGVTEVSATAFAANYEVETVIFPASVTSIGSQAFLDCNVLKEATIPASVTSIGFRAFYNSYFGTCPLKKVHVEAGDADRVKDLIKNADHKVNGITFVQDVPAPCMVTFDANGGIVSPETRLVTKGAALGILPEPTRDGYVFDGWFTAAEGGEQIASALVVNADVTCYAHWTGAVDPESLDPFNPGPLPCYTVLNPADIWDPIRAPKAIVLYGAMYYGCDVVGVVELKVGKIKNYQAKVSGTVTLLNGKKHSIKSQKCGFGDKMATVLNLDVKGQGSMRIAIGNMGGANVFSGSLGKWHVQSANVGGNWSKASATATVEAGNVSMFPGVVLEGLLPTNEVAVVSRGKWAFAKAASVKWTKPKAGQAAVMQDASGKGLVVDTAKGKTNLSGLKLTYTPKKGTFKGSFKVYAMQGTKLKKYTVKVSGVVVDGVGDGVATSTRPAVSWPVTVE